MAKFSSQLVLDSYENVLSNVSAMIITPFAIAFFSALILEAENPSATMLSIIPIAIELLFTWFVWETPMLFISALIPLAIALQVATHSLRTAPNLHENKYEAGRGKAFSGIASLVGAAIILFTSCTVIDGVINFSKSYGHPALITTALIGAAAAVMCIDAARIATTQEIQTRIPMALKLRTARKAQLDKLQINLPSATIAWTSSTITAILITGISTAYWVLVSPPARTATNPEAIEISIGYTMGVAMGILVSLVITLAVYLGVFLLVLIPVEKGRNFKFSVVLGTFLLSLAFMYHLVGRWVISGIPDPTALIISIHILIGITTLTFGLLVTVRPNRSSLQRFPLGMHLAFLRIAGALSGYLFKRCDSYAEWLKKVSRVNLLKTKSLPTARQMHNPINRRLRTMAKRSNRF